MFQLKSKENKGTKYVLGHRTIAVVILMVLILLLPALGGSVGESEQKKELTVELIYGSQELWGREVSFIQWVPDEEKFTYYQPDPETKNLCIWNYDLKTGERKIFIDSEKVKVLEEPKTQKRVTLSNYFWSPTGENILLPSGNDLYLYNIVSGTVKRLTNDEETERDPIFSPDGKKVAFIKNHNIQVLDIETGDVTPLTTEGKEHILIGQSDWAYEEEFDIRTGFFWSPDGKHIAYFQLDENQVPEFPIVDFIPFDNDVHPMRYPKAGDRISTVRIGVVSVTHPTTVWMDIGKETDIYIPRIKWLPDDKTLAIHRLNRDQNKLELLLGDIHTGKTQTILIEEEKDSWIDINDDLTFLNDSEYFFWSSDCNGFKHIYLYNIQGNLIRQITEGKWEVDNIVAVDEKNKVVYFRATEKNLRERHLYRVDFGGEGFKLLSSREGWHSINMAPNCNYYLDSFCNFTTQTKLSLHTNDGKMVDMIEPNEIEALKKYRLPTSEFLSFKTDKGIELNAFMIKPLNFDPDQKYPVLIYTYGGQGSQIVRDAWGGPLFSPLYQRIRLWHQMMAQKGYIIFGVDGRGTGGRGKDWMEIVYQRLGEFEMKDQIAGVKYLRTLPYVDGDRIGIWGWSYGGYLTCMCMLKGADYFKLGIAVGPVTDWKNYDALYTERYMRKPQDNPEGYRESAAFTHVKYLKGKLLLVVGSSDDNVHIANTMQLAYAFQNARIPFDLMVYPRKMHHIKGQDTRVHLFNLITNYIIENL